MVLPSVYCFGTLVEDDSTQNEAISWEERCAQEKLQHGVEIHFADFGSLASVARYDVTSLGRNVRLAAIPFGVPLWPSVR